MIAQYHQNIFVPELGTWRPRIRRWCSVSSRVCCPWARLKGTGNCSVDDCRQCPFLTVVLDRGVWCQLDFSTLQRWECL